MTHTPHSARLSDGLFAALRATQTLTAADSFRLSQRHTPGTATCLRARRRGSATGGREDARRGHGPCPPAVSRHVSFRRSPTSHLGAVLSDPSRIHCRQTRPPIPSQLPLTSCSPRYTRHRGRVARPPPFYRWERTSHRHRPPLRRRAAATRATSATKRSPTASPTPDALQLIATATTGPLRRYRMPASCLTLVL